MAYKPLGMDKIELIKDYHKKGFSIKRISRLTGVSRNTVKKYLRIGQKSRSENTRDCLLESCFPQIVRELGRVGVTRYLLWEEYKKDHPRGFSYSRFCRKLATYRNKESVTLRLEHKAAQVLSVDYAGKKIDWVDNRTGEVKRAEVLVCTMPYSALYICCSGGVSKAGRFCRNQSGFVGNRWASFGNPK